MLDSIFATKLDMSQAWTQAGKRLAVTKCQVKDNLVIEQKSNQLFEIGYGAKKLKNMSKPLKSKLQKGGFSVGVTKISGIKVKQEATTDQGEEQVTPLKVGDTITAQMVLSVGDVVKVQGQTKGKGFTGVMKRHGFAGGPRTHGQSDRERAPGSIGSGTTPGRVWKGLKMAGHSGAATKTVRNLVVIHLDPKTNEVWLNGPIPGFYSSTVKITKLGDTKEIKLDKAASGIQEAPAEDTKEIKKS